MTTATDQVTLRHWLVRRGTASDKWFALDALFPQALVGTPDTWGVDEGTADCLYGLVRALQPRLVFETGTHKGRSTRALAQALQANAAVGHLLSPSVPGHLYTVDAEDYDLYGSGALPPECQSHVTQVLGWTPAVLAMPPLASLTGIDFAFLDGDHSAEGLAQELRYVDAHRAPECWVAVDNSRDPGWPGVAEALAAWTASPRLSLATCTGLDLLWMTDARDRRRAP
jgi:Methyltransferase domain